MDNIQSYGSSFGSTVGGTFSNAVGRIVSFLPHLLAALVILAVGLVIAWALALATRKVLDKAGFDRFLERHEVKRAGGRSGSTFVGRIVYWAVALVTLVAAADALELAWVTAGLARITGYLPNALAALLVAVGAYILGNFAFRSLARSRAGESLAVPRIARMSIYVLGGFMVLQELDIASSIVTLCFALLAGAVAVAAAISFGMGNRQLAAEITRDWYRRVRPVMGEEASERLPGEPPPREPFMSHDLPPTTEPRH